MKDPQSKYPLQRFAIMLTHQVQRFAIMLIHQEQECLEVYYLLVSEGYSHPVTTSAQLALTQIGEVDSSRSWKDEF